MKHLNKDNLEDFFRESLDGYGDHPSDGLWDRIDAQIPPKPTLLSQMQTWHWLTAAGIVLLGLLTYHFVTVKNLATKVQQKEDILAEVQSELERLQQQSSTQTILLDEAVAYQETLEEKLELSENTVTTIQQQAKQVIVEQQSTYEKQLIALQSEIIKNAKTTISTPKVVDRNKANIVTEKKEKITQKEGEEATFAFVKKTTTTSAETGIENSKLVAEATFENSVLELETKKKSIFGNDIQIKDNVLIGSTISLPKRTPCDEINDLDNKDIQLLTTLPIISTNSTDSLPKLPYVRGTMSPTHWWSWSMKAGLHWTNREIRGPTDSELTPMFNAQETGLIGRELGFGLNYHIGKKWVFSTGVQEQLLEQAIQHDLEIVHREENLKDTRGGNEERSKYDYTIETALGDIDMSLDILNQGYVNIGDTIRTRLTGQQKQQAFSFPAIAQLNVINKGNLIIGLRGGFIANYYGNGSAKFDKPNSIADRLHFERAYDIKAFSGLKKFNLNWSVGAIGLFKVTNEWSVFVEPSVMGGLTPIYLKDTIRTYPFRAGANVGVYYNLYDDSSLEGFKKY